MKNPLFTAFISLYLSHAVLGVTPIDIPFVNEMPDFPRHYNMRDWGAISQKYYDFILDPDIKGPGLPVFAFTKDKAMFCIKSYVGDDQKPGTLVAMANLCAILGSTLVGNDMSSYSDKWEKPITYSDYDFVRAANNYYWREDLQLFGPLSNQSDGRTSRSGSVMIFRDYNLWPAMLMQLLPNFYPKETNLLNRTKASLEQFYKSYQVMSVSGSNGQPDFSFIGFDFDPHVMKPVRKGMKEYPQARHGLPEAANGAAYGWIMYLGWNLTGDKKYLEAAKAAIQWQAQQENIELYGRECFDQLFGPLAAARLNVETGMKTDLDAMLRLWFGDFEGKGAFGKWQVVHGSRFQVNGVEYSCDGADGWDGFYPLEIGQSKKNAPHKTGFYGYTGQSLMQPSCLVPIARYYPEYARAIGKYALNVANTAALYQGYGLDWEHQDHKNWKDKYDPDYLLVYEALTSSIWGQSSVTLGPYATGDRTSQFEKTQYPLSHYLIRKALPETDKDNFTDKADNLALYMGNYIGFLGGIVEKTDQVGILRWDCLKTDYYHQPAYPTYLYYNPYREKKSISVPLEAGSYKLYDVVSKKFLCENASGHASIEIPPNTAAVAVVIPNSEPIGKIHGTLKAGKITIDYRP